MCENERSRANFFRSPYHGWTYDSGGRLVGVPYQGGYGPEFDKQEMGLVPVSRLETYAGFVFASRAKEGSFH